MTKTNEFHDKQFLRGIRRRMEGKCRANYKSEKYTQPRLQQSRGVNIKIDA